MNAHSSIEAVAAIAQERPKLGTPCSLPGGGLCYVVNVAEAKAATFTLIGGPAPMSRNRYDVTIANEAGHLSDLSENILAPMIYRARHVPSISEADAADLWERAKVANANQRARNQVAMAKQAAADLAKYAPAWAQAAIVAELHQDDSDSMTDYHNHKTTRVVVIGWSRHRRDLFGEMRKAAATFPETADLADAPESAEHREKYSMGAGFYLKRGWRDSSGWCVKKRRIDWLDRDKLEFSDAARGVVPIVEKAEPAPTSETSAAGGFTVTEHMHTKKGFRMWICTLADRVERDEFDRLNTAAKALGGWYSRAWAGAPAGFAFKSADKAAAFTGANDLAPQAQEEEQAPQVRAAAPAKPAATGADVAAKLRELADGMAQAIADKFADRRANTPKQQRQAAEARQEGTKLERAQKILRALADCHEAGTVPDILAKVRSKAAAVDLALEEIDRRNSGYYDAGMMTGRPYPWREADKLAQAVAAWALIDTRGNAEALKAEALRQKIDGLKFAKIPGYFPTPAQLVARMIEEAALSDGARVLEPSAGSGAIADALRDAGHKVECIERHSTLCDILTGKGHAIRQGDFLEQVAPADLFDAVVMNPPFENGQDVQHVRHAFGFVKPGGRVVAIMGAGVMFRQDSRFAEFRAWADDLGAEFVEIPAGAFKESGTGVASVMITICKD